MADRWSDPARYACASLFALSLSEYDREFSQHSMHRLLQHLKLVKASRLIF